MSRSKDDMLARQLRDLRDDVEDLKRKTPHRGQRAAAAVSSLTHATFTGPSIAAVPSSAVTERLVFDSTVVGSSADPWIADGSGFGAAGDIELTAGGLFLVTYGIRLDSSGSAAGWAQLTIYGNDADIYGDATQHSEFGANRLCTLRLTVVVAALTDAYVTAEVRQSSDADRVGADVFATYLRLGNQ